MAQNKEISIVECEELKKKLYEDANKGILYFYFSSGGMTPRTKEESQKEKIFLETYPKIKIINGGCVVSPCDLEYESQDYQELKDSILTEQYKNNWINDVPIHLGRFVFFKYYQKEEYRILNKLDSILGKGFKYVNCKICDFDRIKKDSIISRGCPKEYQKDTLVKMIENNEKTTRYEQYGYFLKLRRLQTVESIYILANFLDDDRRIYCFGDDYDSPSISEDAANALRELSSYNSEANKLFINLPKPKNHSYLTVEEWLNWWKLNKENYEKKLHTIGSLAKWRVRY